MLLAKIIAGIIVSLVMTCAAACVAWLQYEKHPHRKEQVICRSIVFFVVAFIVLVGGVV